MGDALTEKDALDAVARSMAGRRAQVDVRAPGAAEVTRQSLLECRVVRSIEAREQGHRRHPGPIDLSKQPVYDVLGHFQVDPPADPGVARRLELVRQGSVREQGCGGCENGRTTCSKCNGRGYFSCPAAVACPTCHGIHPCTECGDPDDRRRARPRRAERLEVHKVTRRAGTSTAEASRVTCAKCRAQEAACRGCRGHGRVVCPQCEGSEHYDCSDCAGTGVGSCERCGGTGEVVTWTGGVITHTPDHDELRRPVGKLPSSVREAAKSRGDTRSAAPALGNDLPGDLEPEHRTALEAFLVRRDDEVSRRVELTHLPLVRVDAHQDPHHVHYVFPGRTDLEVVTVLSPRRRWQFGAVAVAGLVLLVIVMRLVG